MQHNKIMNLAGILILGMLITGFTYLRHKQPAFNRMNPIPQQEDFESQWKTVDSLIQLGLPQSALKVTEEIYQKAKADENHPQFIKALLYKIKLNADFKEDFLAKIANDLEVEIKSTQTPVRQILHSILADIYWRYYQANRYKFMERTAIPGASGNDIRTWDLKKLTEEVIDNFRASLENKETLQKTNLKEFDAILETTKESKEYRPTLYDFLAHRAIDFFKNDEASITRPAETFEIDREEFFDQPEKFSKLHLETKDSLAQKFYALRILQDLIRFHLNDSDPKALIDVNLERLEFVHGQAIVLHNDSLYLTSLQKFENTWIKVPSSTWISYAIAGELNRLGQQYNPLVSDEYHWEIKESAEKCREAIKRFPDSDGAENCRVLLSRINRMDLQLKVPVATVPEQSILALLSYKNIPQVAFRLLKPDYDEDRQMQTDYRMREDLLEKYVAMEPVNSWQIHIPVTEDHQPHSAEFEIPATKAGYYVLMASSSDSFNVKNDHITYLGFWISGISYFSEHSAENTYRFYTLNRESGKPLVGVNATLYYRTYDYRTRAYNQEAGGTFTSDDSGMFEIPALDKNAKPNSFFLDLRYKEDRLVTDDRFYHGHHPQQVDRTETKTWFFTDRAIYRPGQTIYFKGIVLDKTGKQYEIKKDFTTTVVFDDANYQKLAELTLTTNDYGSFHGSFTAPQGVLTGNMTLKNETGSVSFSVEEYKRPTFEVTFAPVIGSYKLNETVNVSGQAKAYSGSLISGSQVKYRVVRQVYFPWRYWSFDFWPQTTTMEITNGITQTDEEGHFTLSFKAIPDYSIREKFKPAFTYTIYTDVTDITGETQSAETSVNVSNTALKVDIGLDESVNRDEFDSITFKTTNLNGQHVDATGTFTLARLKDRERLLREKYWQTPDVYLIPEKEYKSKFPHDAWKNESIPDSLAIDKTVLIKEFNSAVDSIITLENADSWEPGKYKLTFKTMDSFGQEVIQTKYFTLFATDDKKPPLKEINWFHVMKSDCEPGDNAACIIGTADKDVFVLYEVVRENEVLKRVWMELNDEQELIEFPVTEELRGGFSVNLYFVKHNRSYQNSFRVEVPYTNKKLDFEFLTFRNKLLPGQKEEWKIKIKGEKGDQVAAELLASMYDASLDAFVSKDWNFDLYNKIYSNLSWNFSNSFSSISGSANTPVMKEIPKPVYINYDRLNWFGFNYYGGYMPYKQGREYNLNATAMPGQAMDGRKEMVLETESISDQDKAKAVEPAAEKGTIKKPGGVELRRDLRETAFFYPVLNTDENGDVVIRFEMPESLTRWKFRGLAYSKNLKTGTFEKEVITQKDLMVVPNPPRFFRQGDQMAFSAKVVNLSANTLHGEAELRFFETTTMNDITDEIVDGSTLKDFTINKKENKALFWNIAIPEKFSVISYRITCKAGNFSDGEEKPIPVLTNRMLVTESLPLPVNGNETKHFTFEKLKNSGTQNTLKNHRLTLEFSSNPAWYAVQALPYIMEKERESADAIFDRFYANAIASQLAGSNPKIRQVFEVWKNFEPDALLSNLEKNQELKSLILQETPWVLDAGSEKEQKQHIALLFDINRMAAEKEVALHKLQQKQSPGGGWPWFNGMPDNRYITQEIVLGFAHLKSMHILDPKKDEQINAMLIRAVRYLDQEMKEDYDYILNHSNDKINDDHLSRIMIHYLLARSYFMEEVPISKSQQEAFGYFRDQAKLFWNKKDLYAKAMIAMALNNLGVKSAPSQIMASIREHALYSEELGMYFRDNTYGYYWYEAPIETQALLIEAFDVIMNDQKAVDQMKTWLLKQKQTQAWQTSKATADAVYALLLRGTDWLESDKLAEITIGNQTLDPTKMDDTKVEAGTGYFKTSWSDGEIKPNMGNITVTNENPSIAWGAVYWQYFEDLDKITTHETPLSLKKALFVERNTTSGPVIEPITESSTLKVGDKIKVRIELRVDRDMDFVHMKDMRASAFEPVNALSGYRFQDGLGYYESTLDASTNFFFDYLRKGTYVFEYPLVVSQKGDFSNGITSIQCMYAPEFTSHSEGVRVIIE